MRPLTILALTLAGTAHAADVDRFEPSGSSAYGHGTLQGEAPFLAGEGFGGGLFASFAQDPVIRLYEDGRRVSEVSAMMPLALYGGYTYGDHARFEAFLPVYGWVDAPISDFRGAAVGDLRVQANLPLYEDDVLALSVVPRLGLPTGTSDALTRQGFQGSLLAALGGEIPDVAIGWVANLGVTGAEGSELEGVALGSTFDGLIGGYWRASDGFRVGTELDLRAGLVRAEAGANTTSTWHAFAQNVLPSGLGMTVGGGTGIIGGLGAPEYRAFAAITYANVVPDRDRDGIVDASDPCATDAEDLDGFEDTDGCPDRDNDGDGIGDYTDQCDDAREDLDGFADSDGCPDLDNDGDTVADADDSCPDAAGSAAARGCPDGDGDGLLDSDDLCPGTAGPVAAYGCPDADEDAVADYRDACLDEPKAPTEEADWSDGCPKLAWLAGDRIELAERVDFVTTGAVLRPRSKTILAEVARLLETYPQIKEVEVQVHLDDSQGEEKALTLTQERADAILFELGRLSVDTSRIVAKGYGKTRPVDTNRTESGRYNNRRVELHILRQEAIPRPQWPPPPPSLAAPAAPRAPAPGTSTGASPWGPVEAPDDAGAPGTLAVQIQGGGWADVFVDGERVSRTAPFADLRLPVGVHDVRVANGAGIEHSERIEIIAGKTVTILIEQGGPWGATPEPKPGESSPWGPAEPAPKRPAEFDGSFPLFPEEEEELEDLDADEKEKRPPRGSKKRK